MRVDTLEPILIVLERSSKQWYTPKANKIPFPSLLFFQLDIKTGNAI